MGTPAGGYLQQQYMIGPGGQPVLINTDLNATSVYDGRGGVIQGYNVRVERRFGAKTGLFCCIVLLLFWPAAICVPLCPCDEVVTGQTIDGSTFTIHR